MIKRDFQLVSLIMIQIEVKVETRSSDSFCVKFEWIRIQIT